MALKIYVSHFLINQKVDVWIVVNSNS